ncbi:MAG: hypothetical protein ACXV8U_15510 [Methylobacter sp.]
MIGLLTDEAINRLPIDQQARLKRLPDNLSIDIIAKLMMQPYQGIELDRTQKYALTRNRSAMKTSIIEACTQGLLAYQMVSVDVFIPEYKAPKQNSYLINDGASISLSNWGRRDFAAPTRSTPKRDGVDGHAAIHKTEFMRYLQSVGMWPVSSHYPPELNMPYENLIGNWWPDDTVSQAPDKNKSAGGFIFTPPEHRKNREELDELRHSREEKQRERDKKRREEERREFDKRTQFIIDQPKRYKEMLIEVQMEAQRRLEVENQAKEAQKQTETVADDGGQEGKPKNNSRKKGDADKARAEHLIRWVEQKEYVGGRYDEQIVDSLRTEEPTLWGAEGTHTFKKWLKTPEGRG